MVPWGGALGQNYPKSPLSECLFFVFLCVTQFIIIMHNKDSYIQIGKAWLTPLLTLKLISRHVTKSSHLFYPPPPPPPLPRRRSVPYDVGGLEVWVEVWVGGPRPWGPRGGGALGQNTQTSKMHFTQKSQFFYPPCPWGQGLQGGGGWGLGGNSGQPHLPE